MTSKRQCNWHVWWFAARPRTLPATLAPLLLGNGLVLIEGQGQWWLAALSLLCALLLQVLVNYANDLADGLAGVDNETRLGPPRMIQQGLISIAAMRRAIVLLILLACVCGLLLAAASSWWLLLPGGACLLAALAYSGGPWPLVNYGLGEFTCFLFFGPVAVLGAAWVQSGQWQWPWLAASLAVGLPIAAIMLVNNLRDRDGDAAVGKRTLAVRLGQERSLLLYGLLLFIPPLLISLCFDAWWALLVAAALAWWALQLWQKVAHSQGQALNALLAATARYPVAISVAWLLLSIA